MERAISLPRFRAPITRPGYFVRSGSVAVDLINRKGAKKRHLMKSEARVRQFPSRYEATAMCGIKLGGEYQRTWGATADVDCAECLAAIWQPSGVQ